MKNIFYILILILLVSCTSNTIYEKPKDLIPKDTMINLLTDLYIASSANSVKNKNLQVNVKYMPLVFNKYNIDSARFKNSNVYYLSKIDEYEHLFESLRENLKEIQKKFKNKEDSLRTVQQEKVKKIKEKKRSLNETKLNLKEFNALKNRDTSRLQKKQ